MWRREEDKCSVFLSQRDSSVDSVLFLFGSEELKRLKVKKI